MPIDHLPHLIRTGLGEEEDGSLDTRLAQPHPLLDQRHGEHRCARLQGSLGHGHVAVAVAVGLDHDAHFGWGDQFGNGCHVVSNGAEIDLDPRRPHAVTPANPAIDSSSEPAVTVRRLARDAAALPCQ